MANRSSIELKKDYYEWLAWTLLAPVISVVLVYVIGLISGLINPFTAIFGTGDVLAIAALWLVPVAQDIEKIDEASKKEHFVAHSTLLILFASLLWLAYGGLKTVGVKISQNSPLTESDLSTLVAISVFSIAAALLAGAYAIYIRSNSMKAQVGA